MKRRNFFSKIAKGLLGIGIVKALPTPEVETVPSTPPNLSEKELDRNLNTFRQTLNRNRQNVDAYTISGVDSPKGFVEIGNELYITEPDDHDVIVHHFIDKRTGKEVKGAGDWCYDDPNIEVATRYFNLPEGWEKGLPSNKRKT